MKKLAKPLILLLVVSLLVGGAFVISAFADDTTATTQAVGSYTKPEGSWTPADDAVLFATFASEDDFLTNQDPIKAYTDAADLNTANIKNVGYIHLFKDVKLTSRPNTTNTQQLIINLGGKTLDTSNQGFRVGDDSVSVCTATLLIKNGTFTNGGQFQTRKNTTTIFDNVVYNANNTFAYDTGLKLMEFRDCILNVGYNKNWDLTVPGDKDKEGNLINPTVKFVNTDVIQTTATSTVALFQIKTANGVSSAGSATIIFDKDSSITRTANAPLVVLDSAFSVSQYKDPTAEVKELVDPADVVYPEHLSTQYLYFEEGCVVSTALAPNAPYAYHYNYYNASAGKTAVQVYGEGAKSLETKYSVGANDAKLAVGVLKDGEVIDWMTLDQGDGTVKLIKTPTPEDAFDPTDEEYNGKYAGITYGIWESEFNYLIGEEPKDFSTSELLDGALFGSATDNGNTIVRTDFVPGFVRCFADVKNTACVTVVPKQTLVIDLGGFTFSQSAKVQIGGSSSGDKKGTSLTVKNGTWYKVTGQIQPRPDVAFIVENVDLSLGGTGYVFYGYAGYTRFTDSKVTFREGGHLQLAANGTACSEFIFENTDLVFTKSPATLFQTSGNVKSWNIVFDGESSIQGLTGAWTSEPTVADGATITINFNDGFAATKGTVYPTSAGVVVVNKGTTVELCAHEAGTPTEENRVESTCANAGYYESVVYCTVCNEEISRTKVTLEKADHTPADAVTENEVVGNCETGSSYDTVVYCKVCSNEISRTTTETPAIGHHWIKDTCTNCGAVANVWKPAKDSGVVYAVWLSESDYIAGSEPKATYTDGELNNARIGITDTAGKVYGVGDYIPGYVHAYGNLLIKDNQLVTGVEQKLVINLNGFLLEGKQGIRVGCVSGSTPNATLTIKDGDWNTTGGQLQLRGDTTFILENVNWSVSSNNFMYGCTADYIRFTNCNITSNGNNLGFAGNYPNIGSRGQFIFENTELHFTSIPSAPFFAFAASGCNYDFYFDKDSAVIGIINEWYSVADSVVPGAITFTFEDGFTILDDISLPKSTDDGKVTVTSGELNTIIYLVKGYDKEGNLITGWTEPYIPAGIIDYIPDGGMIKLFADTTVDAIHTNKGWSLTFDLNGYTLKIKKTSENIQLGHSQSGAWLERVITFTSSNGRGILDASERTGNTFQARPGTIAVFENLDITFGGNGFNDGGAKEITFRNCNVVGLNPTAYISGLDGFGAGAGNARVFNFDNTTLTGMLIHSNKVASKDNLTINFTNGSVIDNYEVLLLVKPSERNDSTNGISGERTFTINVSLDTKFTHYNMNYTYFSEGTDNCVLNYNISNYAVWTSGEYYVLGEKTTVSKDALSANLTLYSDFSLNFFANPEMIEAIIYNGNVLSAEEWNGTIRYTLEGITPDTAADNLQFIVVVKVGEEKCYMTLNYSVLKYAEKAVNTTDTYGRELVSAVMAYVQAAYEYAGKTAPAFTGVAYTAAPVEPAAPAINNGAILTAQLELTSGVNIRFNLNPEYTGALVVGDTKYEVTDGTVAENVDYVVVNLRAYQLAESGVLVIDKDNNRGIYTLANYLYFAENYEGEKAEELLKLVEALYDYSYFASEYKKAN